MANSQRTSGKTEGNRKCPQVLQQEEKKARKKENKPLPQREKRIMSLASLSPFHSLSLSCGRFVISILFSNDFPPLIAHLFLVFTVQFSPFHRNDATGL